MLGSVGAKHVVCGAAVTCPARSPLAALFDVKRPRSHSSTRVRDTATVAHAFKTLFADVWQNPFVFNISTISVDLCPILSWCLQTFSPAGQSPSYMGRDLALGDVRTLTARTVVNRVRLGERDLLPDA